MTVSELERCPGCGFTAIPGRRSNDPELLNLCACGLFGIEPPKPNKPEPDIVTLWQRAQDDLCSLWEELRRAIRAQMAGDRVHLGKRLADARRIHRRLADNVAAIGAAITPRGEPLPQAEDPPTPAVENVETLPVRPDDPMIAAWIAGRQRGPGVGCRGVEVLA